uniref:Uncharacterized protein n=2 Tax=Picea TaxID=3328 RepID=A0A101M3N6_PICGL|nr:hypothetical protein ABT39_MTgene211 [Picea glauca]QHR90088.1 hypothetical protein Q903MT_gene4111 [Picea sitchensis]
MDNLFRMGWGTKLHRMDSMGALRAYDGHYISCLRAQMPTLVLNYRWFSSRKEIGGCSIGLVWKI